MQVAARLTTTEAESALVETPESEGTPVAETISAGATPTTATSSGKDAGKLLKDTGKSVKDADKFIKAPYAIGELRMKGGCRVIRNQRR